MLTTPPCWPWHIHDYLFPSTSMCFSMTLVLSRRRRRSTTVLAKRSCTDNKEEPWQRQTTNSIHNVNHSNSNFLLPYEAKFSRVQDFGSKVEFLADIMCEFRTVKVAGFTPKRPILAAVQGAIVQDSMFDSFVATCSGKHTGLYTDRQANSRLARCVRTHCL